MFYFVHYNTWFWEWDPGVTRLQKGPWQSVTPVQLQRPVWTLPGHHKCSEEADLTSQPTARGVLMYPPLLPSQFTGTFNPSPPILCQALCAQDTSCSSPTVICFNQSQQVEASHSGFILKQHLDFGVSVTKENTPWCLKWPWGEIEKIFKLTCDC